MSVFIRQHAIPIEYTKENWTILNPIEQSIKSKIEKYGTPLKEWDISINYGIKTGCNEAFIIDGKKRAELIAEDPRSDEIIRPILRGRDIKRYGYEFADLYIIATFPSKNYNIDDYPAVKKWLRSFGKKLEQTGEVYIDEHGQKQKCRKKTNNKWFETQDSIGYWNDFSKQKIVYPCIMAQEPCFMLDNDQHFPPAPGNIITGANLEYLLGFLCSKICYFALRQFYMGGGIEGELKTNRLLILPIPLPYNGEKISLLVNKLLCKITEKQFIQDDDKEIEQIVANSYHLSNEEIEFILNSEYFSK